jgi:hypothetical protein
MDSQQPEILTYRAFRDREARLEWEKRRRMHECFGGLEPAANDRSRSGLWWIRSAGAWVSDQVRRGV